MTNIVIVQGLWCQSGLYITLADVVSMRMGIIVKSLNCGRKAGQEKRKSKTIPWDGYRTCNGIGRERHRPMGHEPVMRVPAETTERRPRTYNIIARSN